MVFQAIGIHSFKVSVGDPNCPSLIVYGQTVLKRRPDLQLEACNVPIMMKINPFPLVQGKRRGFGKTFKGKESTPNFEHKKKDMSKVQCFRCDKYGHYAKNCPTWKKGKQHASTANVDLEPPQRKSRNASMNDEELFFISSLSNMVPTSNDVWLIDSGGYRHMTG
jgi:hypothetical protein